MGGNDKGQSPSLLTTEAASGSFLLCNKRDNIRWGVVNPNDPQSVHSIQEKVEQSGIQQGILTKPLLASCAFGTLQRYKKN